MKFFKYILMGAALFLIAEGSGMAGIFEDMDAGQRALNERSRKTVLIYMSPEDIYPDERVRALAEAAGDGNVSKVEALVRQGVDVNSRGAQGATPLFWAMRNIAGYRKLLELGADPNLEFGGGMSVMRWSLPHENPAILRLALEHGGNPNLVFRRSNSITGSDSRPLIFDALAYGDEKVIVLLNAGAEINGRDSLGRTPLLYTAFMGNFRMTQLLLERGADYSAKDNQGNDLATFISRWGKRVRSGTPQASDMEKVVNWLKQRGVVVQTD